MLLGGGWKPKSKKDGRWNAKGRRSRSFVEKKNGVYRSKCFHERSQPSSSQLYRKTWPACLDAFDTTPWSKDDAVKVVVEENRNRRATTKGPEHQRYVGWERTWFKNSRISDGVSWFCRALWRLKLQNPWRGMENSSKSSPIPQGVPGHGTYHLPTWGMDS